jgi:hypothetical protein
MNLKGTIEVKIRIINFSLKLTMTVKFVMGLDR